MGHTPNPQHSNASVQARIFCRAASLMGLLILSACATFADRGPVYTATSVAPLDPSQPPGMAQRSAAMRAEIEARDQLLYQVSQLKLNDGRRLQDLAIVDPNFRAQLRDTIRAAQIKERKNNEDGSVTVTVRLELKPVYQAVADYSGQGVN